MEVTGYQTLEDSDNIDEIEFDGPFKCTRSDAWLGHGYYFWDSNLEWAIDWGKNSYNKRGKEFVIGSCRINLDSCFDLIGNVEHQQELIDVIKVMQESGLIKGEKKFILPNILEYLKHKGLFTYNSIRSADNYNPIQIHYGENRQEYLMINQRVQICVIKKNEVILTPFGVIYLSEKI